MQKFLIGPERIFVGDKPKSPGIVPRVGRKIFKIMKKFLSLFLFVIIFGSCEKNQLEEKEPLLDGDNLLNKIEGVTLKDVMEHFGVDSSSELAIREFESSTKSDYTIIAVFDEQYEDAPELADKVIYLEASGDIPVIINTFERKTFEDENSRIEISVGIRKNPVYVIEYNLEQEYTNFTHLKWGYEDCVDGCLHDILDGIFNEGSWLRRARFIANAPVEMAWHIADCSIYCL